MIDLAPVLSAAFITGLLGSVHCLGMCAGISGLFAVNSGIAALHGQLAMALTYNAGRILSYAILGTIVASFGGALVKAVPGVAGPIRFATGAIIILIGVQVAFDLRLLAPLEKTGAMLWQKLAPAAKRFVPVTSLPRALGLGFLWGWLPCGLVYSVLLLAATSARAIDGAATMIAFGIGTMPAMVMTGIGAVRLSSVLRRAGARVGLGLLLVIIGALTIAVPVSAWLSASRHYHG